MKLIISSPSRLASFLANENVHKKKSRTALEIKYALSLIGDRDWSEIVVTHDIAADLHKILKRNGMLQLMDRHKVTQYYEDDTPELDRHDYAIAIHGDQTLTTASFDVAKAA